MKLKVIATGEMCGGTSVVDAETGKKVENVRLVEFVHKAGELPTLRIEVAGFDAQGMADVVAEGVVVVDRT